MGPGQLMDEEGAALSEQDFGGDELEPSTAMYWAAKPAAETIKELAPKERAYFDFIARKGFGDAWLGAYCAYYGIDPDSMAWESHSIGTDGDQGELLRFRINEMRSYVRQSMTMAIGQRPAFEAVAVNDKYETLASVEDADTAINYIYWAKYGERKERRTIEKGDLFGLGWTWVNFDTDGGPEIEVPIELPPEAGGGPSPRTQKQRVGELVVKSRAPWEVFYEPTIEDFDDHVWRCVRDRASKWELAARFPEHAAEIVVMTCEREYAIEALFGFDSQQVNADELIVKHFYHAKTRALPNGRYLMYVGNLPLYDGPLPFELVGIPLPLVDYCPAEFIGTALGYADSWDLIPINQMLDQVLSDTATSVANLGRPTMVVEDGIDFDAEAIASGFKVLTVPPGGAPPTYMQAPPLSEGAQFIFELLESKYASVSGLNQTARGQSTTNVTSGEMAALFHSIAIEVNSGKQMAVDSHRERVANLMLQIGQQYMQHPILLTITGADGRKQSKMVDPVVFNGVQQVVIKTANPMSRTQAGRLQKAQMMLSIPGAVQTPEQFDELMASGQLKPLYKAPRSMTQRIAWENEQLRKGAPVQQGPDPQQPVKLDGTPNIIVTVPTIPAYIYDPHDKEIPEHRAEFDDQRCRGNEAGCAALSAHIADHMRQWRLLDPDAAGLLKIPTPGSSMAMPESDETDEGADDSGGEQRSEPRARDSTGVPIPRPAKPPVGARPQP